MKPSTPKNRLPAVGVVLVAAAVGAGMVAAQETTPPPPLAPAVSVREIPRDLAAHARETVRVVLRENLRAHEVRDEVRAAIRDHLRDVREIRAVHVELRDAWREVVGVCPLDSAGAHGDDSGARLVHTLAATVKELTPKIGVLIGTGAKLLGQLLTAL